MRITFFHGFGTTLVILVIAIVTAVITGIFAAVNSPPYPAKSEGLLTLEEKVDREFRTLVAHISSRAALPEVETLPPLDPDAPLPSGTYLYNNLLENLLSGLHFYFPVPEDTPSTIFVTSWDAETGNRVSAEFIVSSLEYNVNYLLTLELYRRLHAKAIFDEDLEYARARVHQIFSGELRTNAEWPIGAYFDLVELYELTGEESYLEYAEHFAVGNGPGDSDTPLTKAKNLAFKFNLNFARQASPVYFLYAALLADYGNRHDDPELIRMARSLFGGLKDILYDSRFRMLWKRAAVPADNSPNVNLTQTFSTLEQVFAIRAIIDYGRDSGDPEALSLARSILSGMWGEEANSPLLINAPPGWSETTYYGLSTAYDYDREAERMDPDEITIVQILFYLANVLVNEETRGEFRADVDFLSNWLEDNGPMYRRSANGYYITYEENWEDPEPATISSQASIWMARALAEDEWYRYRVAQALASSDDIP